MDTTATATVLRPPAALPGPAAAVPDARRAPTVESLPCVWALPSRPESAGTARRLTHAALQAWGVDEDATHQILLVVSELVTNAVEHALPPIALHLDRPAADGTVHVEVDDGGPAPREGAWTASCTPEEHGRGNSIIDLLATAYGTRPLPQGITHWADLPTPDRDHGCQGCSSVPCACG